MAWSVNLSVPVGKPELQHSACCFSPPIKPLNRLTASQFSSISNIFGFSFRCSEALDRCHLPKCSPSAAPEYHIVTSAKQESLKIMISGAPASGKGTQCALITKKFGLVHIAAGDLLRKEIAAGTANGKRAKEYMQRGKLVPDEIVVTMVKKHLLRSDSQENGWLLDGYPRSSSQATALQELGFEPDAFILLEVAEEVLVERVVGRRMDPITGRILHMKYSPPESEEIASRLIQRFDDTKEKVKLRLRTHHQNVEAVLALYKDITIKVDGNASKEEVFAQIDCILTKILERKKAASGTGLLLQG